MARFSMNANSSGVNNFNLDSNGVSVNIVNSSDNKNNHEDIGSNNYIINNNNIRTASVYDICHPLVM